MDMENNTIVEKEGSTLTIPENRTHTGSDIAPFTEFPNHHEINVNPSRRDLNLQTSYGFLVDNLLSPEECQFYIDESLKKGYRTIEKEFPKEYRNNTRYLGKCKTLSNVLWTRLQHHFKTEEVENIKPYGFDQDGIWIPLGLDDCFTFGRYEPGGRFKPHLDATYAESPDTRSIYTMQIYLNDDYNGGKTNFYLPANPLELDKHVMTESVQPKRGTALIFNHDTLHEGAEVTSGVKFILRVDMMFLRIKRGNDMPADQKEKLQRARELFFKADSLEKDTGDLVSAIETYVKAQMLLAELPSVDSPVSTSTTSTTTTTDKSPSAIVKTLAKQDATIYALPEIILFNILVTCSLKDIINFRSTCKSMYKTLTKNALWKKVYIKLYSYESFIFEEPNAELLDKPKTKVSLLGSITKKFQRMEVTPTEPRCWFITVQNIHSAHVRNNFVFLDIGRNITKYCLLNSSHQVLPSRASIHYEYAPHYAMSSFDREYWNVGYNASANHQIPIEKGEFDVGRVQCTIEIIKHCFHSFSKRLSSTHPYVLALTPPMINKAHQQNHLVNLRRKQHNELVLYKDAGLCVLQSHGIESGIVVMVGVSATFIINYSKGKMLSHVDFAVNGTTVVNYVKDKNVAYQKPKEIQHLFVNRTTYDTRPADLIDEWYKHVSVSMEYQKDATKSSIGESLFYSAPELFFNPGLDNIQSVGIVEAIVNAYAEIPEAEKPNIKNVVLTGGIVKIPNSSAKKSIESIIVSMGVNIESIYYKGWEVFAGDLLYPNYIRKSYKPYLMSCDVVIFVVDSSDYLQISAAKEQIDLLLSENCINSSVFLVLANKQDLKKRIAPVQLENYLELYRLNVPWKCIPTSVESEIGIEDSIKWILENTITRTVPIV
ncbi:hypothetical protein PPL_00836 [Heterostelium album PN500]|uniref:Fe2OG dioxygenase domain-containing protein n=1 Tax=Heterostelium pallidum (strain ATCC 26659 / Pp 5 / PN500) TaxID=670386 RepID=D3AXK5_HETP5|nr:hypothetical protein PPL_00836 [Heterostelium album PN500]EFA86274.1 hypothetical protein PPL_00836 [Heterostelium album PN500]|eukprot:XP_020438379.1 hypothetical protein PPL_00836 [Heterostelium album PN500]